MSVGSEREEGALEVELKSGDGIIAGEGLCQMFNELVEGLRAVAWRGSGAVCQRYADMVLNVENAAVDAVCAGSGKGGRGLLCSVEDAVFEAQPQELPEDGTADRVPW